MYNWLDRAIGYVSPIRGARRAAARMALAQLGYEGARKGRRTDGWVTRTTDADAESQPVVTDLRNRARDLVRNNPYAARAAAVKVTETVGAGILAEIPNARLRAMWERFVAECDADGKLDFYGLQSLVERCRYESGECLVRFVEPELTAEEIRDGAIPLRLRVMEPDYIDTSRDGEIEGRQVRYGIEYAGGRPSAYWLYDEHPGASSASVIRSIRHESRRVDASEVLHVYRRLRPGQTRGVTEFAPVMLTMRDLGDYDDAELMRKKVNAVLAAFVTSPQGAGSTVLGPVTTDSTGRIENLYPGMVSYLKPGEAITFNEPKSDSGYADYKRFTARDIAAGLGIPYELMTGDLSQVNYSSYRAGLVSFRRQIEQDQYQIHVPQLCVPVWSRFVRVVRMMTGQEQMGARTRIEWTPPRFELVDPLKETQAEIEAIGAGLDSWPEVVRRHGWVASEQLDAIEQWQKELTRRGIVLTSDPRTSIAAKATAQSAPPRDPDDTADEDEEEAA